MLIKNEIRQWQTKFKDLNKNCLTCTNRGCLENIIFGFEAF